MSMKTVKLTELSEDVRSFLGEAGKGDGVMVEDETGQARYSIAPYHRSTADERAAALERLRRLQNETRLAMEEQGVTEEDIDRLLQEDK
jgi:hypothetical protein